jgi:hypothetical protein
MRRRLIALLSLLSVMTLVYLKPADAAEPGAAPAAESNGLRLLEEMQAVITELAETAKPSVVSLFPTNPWAKDVTWHRSVCRMRPAPVRASSSRRPATLLPTITSWEILRRLKSGSPTAQN